MTIITHSPKETEEFAKKLATEVKSGDILCLSGEVGAGKSAFTRGLALGLGITQAVTSPTYTIVNEYPEASPPLFHFDLYNVKGEEHLFSFGFEEYLHREGVCVIEWCEEAKEILNQYAPRLTLVKISFGEEETERKITVEKESMLT